MSLIVLTSASGSPGVTTTALGLTLTWPRPVLLVEADPTGASAVFAGFFRGGVEPTGGLINLAVAHREGTLARSLPRETLVLDQGGGAEGSAWFLPGAQSHEQAPSLVLLWEPMTTVLRSLHQHGQDVIVDAGRLGLAGWPEPLVLGADLTLLVSRNSLPSLAGARPWAKTLRARFAETGGLPRLGVLMVDEEQRWPAPVPAVRPYSGRQVTKAVGLPVVASVDWEPRAAEVYSHSARPPRKFDTSGLIRGYRAAAAAITAAIGATQADLDLASTGGQQ